MAENKHAVGTYHQPSWVPHIGSGGVENETDVQTFLSIPHCQKSGVYSKEKVYYIYNIYIYIYVYQVDTVSNIANFRNYKRHISATFDIRSFQPKSTPLAVLLLKNLRGRKRCAALPKRCSPEKSQIWPVKKCFFKSNLMWLCWILELGAKCQKTAWIGLNQLGTDYIQRAESKVKLLQVLKY